MSDVIDIKVTVNKWK